MGFSFRLTARVLLYAPSHRQDSTYHSLCYTSRGALAGTRNSSMSPPHEGSIRWPTTPWAKWLSWERITVNWKQSADVSYLVNGCLVNGCLVNGCLGVCHTLSEGVLFCLLLHAELDGDKNHWRKHNTGQELKHWVLQIIMKNISPADTS